MENIKVPFEMMAPAMRQQLVEFDGERLQEHKTRPAINMRWRTDKISATYLLHFSALYSATKDVTKEKENIFLLGLFSAVSVQPG